MAYGVCVSVCAYVSDAGAHCFEQLLCCAAACRSFVVQQLADLVLCSGFAFHVLGSRLLCRCFALD
jgi:hypothetical protein